MVLPVYIAIDIASLDVYIGILYRNGDVAYMEDKETGRLLLVISDGAVAVAFTLGAIILIMKREPLCVFFCNR